MTVCIGALCDAKDVENTANIILCADTLVTYTSGGVPVTSNPNGSKIFSLPLGFRCAIADDLTNSHVYVSKLADGMRGLSPNDPALYDKVELALQNTNEYIRNHLRLKVCSDFHVTLDEYLHDPNLVQRQQIDDALDNYRVPVEMIIAGFCGGKPLLFHSDSLDIQEEVTVGFYTAADKRQQPSTSQIGSGGDLALYWLNFRMQSLFMSSQRTAYHVMEAKAFAEQNPTVGKRGVILFMSESGTSMLDTLGGLPQIIQTWKDLYYIKNTEPLDRDAQHDVLFSLFTPLTSRT
jgi:hypothetical protein